VSSPDAETPAVVAHPVTGEVLVDLDTQPPELLAHALVAVRARTAALAAGEKALEAELRRRLKILDRKLVVFGDWEVETGSSRESVWDVDELEGALERLVEEGVVKAAEVAEVVTRTPVASRSKAKALLARLDGPAREQVAAACTWRDKPGKLAVVRSVQLPAPADTTRSALAPVPPGSSPDGDGRPRDAAPAPVAPSATPIDLNPQELFA
jgi:hypothetical protein